MCLMHITYTLLAQNNGTGWMSALTYSNLCLFIPVPDDTKSQIHTASSFISAELLYSLRCWMAVCVYMALSISLPHTYICMLWHRWCWLILCVCLTVSEALLCLDLCSVQIKCNASTHTHILVNLFLYISAIASYLNSTLSVQPEPLP